MKKFMIDKIKGKLLANCRRLHINADVKELPDGKFYVEFDTINSDISDDYNLPRTIELFDELPIQN